MLFGNTAKERKEDVASDELALLSHLPVTTAPACHQVSFLVTVLLGYSGNSRPWNLEYYGFVITMLPWGSVPALLWDHSSVMCCASLYVWGHLSPTETAVLDHP